jgi:hypothetical protein
MPGIGIGLGIGMSRGGSLSSDLDALTLLLSTGQGLQLSTGEYLLLAAS